MRLKMKPKMKPSPRIFSTQQICWYFISDFQSKQKYKSKWWHHFPRCQFLVSCLYIFSRYIYPPFSASFLNSILLIIIYQVGWKNCIHINVHKHQCTYFYSHFKCHAFLGTHIFNTGDICSQGTLTIGLPHDSNTKLS